MKHWWCKFKLAAVLAAWPFVLPGGAPGQSAAGDEAADAVKGGPSFKVASWGEWKGPELFARRGSNWQKIDILDLGYSAEMPFKRGEPIVLSKKTKGKNGDVYLPVITATVSESCKQPLLMLFSSDAGDTRHFVVDVDPGVIPWGSYYFVNFTEARLVGMVGKTMFSLNPGKTHLANPEKDKNNRLAIQVKAVKGEDSEMVYSNMLINRPTKRMLVFFYPAKGESGDGHVETRCLVDFQQE